MDESDWKTSSKKKQKKAKEQEDDDNEQCDTVSKIKLVYQGIRIKELKVTGNLNDVNTMMIITNLTPHNEMRTNVIHSF